MNPTRRMGPSGSAIWNSMLDGAEDVLREEGYGALTSRKVAQRIGVKQRLVYYYFTTMDHLIVEAFKRLAAREIARLYEATKSRHPVKNIWKVFAETADTRMVSEFMALANRSKPLRREVKAFIQKTRKMQVSALSDAMSGTKTVAGLPPDAAVIFATGAALLLHREAAIGIRAGHAETLAVIRKFVAAHGQS